MADNSIAVLNVGSQSVSLGLFENTKNGLKLNKYASSSVLADPANEAVRLAQVKVAVENLIEQLGLSKASVIYAVSGNSVFTRFVKLPALGDNDIEQLVTFEAQQHIPFPINEVAWDWELMDSSGAEKEVAIVAIKKDLLNEIDTAVSDAGLSTMHAQSAPISLANAYYYAYPDSSESTLIIDAGAKSTNLIYIEGKRVFVRSVNVSGISLTSAISKEYQVEFSEAERYKTEAGRIALNGTYLQEWDEATAALATVISNSISRLPSEISRTTNFFRSQHSGTPPKKVLLAGAGASLPYFKEFIEEKLKLPTEYFNPFRRVALGKSIDSGQISSQAHTMGELVGLALKSAEKNTFDIDLIPDAIADRREEARKRPYFVGAVVALITGCAVWAGAQYYFAGVGQEKLAEINQKVKVLEPHERGLRELQKKREILDSSGNDYSRLIEDRYRSVNLLEELRGYFGSEFVWMESLEELVNYEFIQKEDKVDAKNGDYVNADITTVPYGKSALKQLELNPKVKSAVTHINAVRVKGYWRKNKEGQGVVYQILESLKTTPDSSFTFSPGGSKVDDNQVLQIKAIVGEDDYRAPFTMIIPLAEPVTVLY